MDRDILVGIRHFQIALHQTNNELSICCAIPSVFILLKKELFAQVLCEGRTKYMVTDRAGIVVNLKIVASLLDFVTEKMDFIVVG